MDQTTFQWIIGIGIGVNTALVRVVFNMLNKRMDSLNEELNEKRTKGECDLQLKVINTDMETTRQSIVYLAQDMKQTQKRTDSTLASIDDLLRNLHDKIAERKNVC